MKKPVIDLFNLNPANLIKMVDKCQKDVWLVTEEGDRLNLKSKLCQFMGLARLIEGGVIAKASIECDSYDDFLKLFEMCVQGAA